MTTYEQYEEEAQYAIKDFLTRHGIQSTILTAGQKTTVFTDQERRNNPSLPKQWTTDKYLAIFTREDGHIVTFEYNDSRNNTEKRIKTGQRIIPLLSDVLGSILYGAVYPTFEDFANSIDLSYLLNEESKARGYAAAKDTERAIVAEYNAVRSMFTDEQIQIMAENYTSDAIYDAYHNAEEDRAA